MEMKGIPEEQPGGCDLICRVRLEVVRPDGEVLSMFTEQHCLPGAGIPSERGGLVRRVIECLGEVLVPRFRQKMRHWMETEMPSKGTSFEDEYYRRFDPIKVLGQGADWSTVDKEERDEWMKRVVEMAAADEVSDREN